MSLSYAAEGLVKWKWFHRKKKIGWKTGRCFPLCRLSVHTHWAHCSLSMATSGFCTTLSISLFQTECLSNYLMEYWDFLDRHSWYILPTFDCSYGATNMSIKHNVVHSWQRLNSADSSLSAIREQLWFWTKYLTDKFGTFMTLMSCSECLQTYSLQCLLYNTMMILTHSRSPALVQASELLSVISVPLTPCWDWNTDPDITSVRLSLSLLSLSFPCVSSLHLLFSFLKGGLWR